MSCSDSEAYNHDYDLLVNKGSRAKHSRSTRNSPENIILTKTIYDPHNALSKRAQNRLLADDCDGVHAYVPYSLNKQQRWEINPTTLLRRQSFSNPEIYVVQQEVSPLSSHPTSSTVTSVRLLNDDGVMTLSSKRRKMTLDYFIKRLKEIQESEDCVENAKILYNVYTQPLLPQKKKRQSKAENKKRVKINESSLEVCSDSELSDSFQEVGNEASLESTQQENSPRIITLGDFICSENASMSAQRTNPPSKSSEGSSFEMIRPETTQLLDISKVTNASHIFEIIDVIIKGFDSFNLYEEVKQLLPFYCTLQCFDDERVSVRSRPTDRPLFVLFFETLKKQRKLRIRINTSTPYSSSATKENLFAIFRSVRGFSGIFQDLLEFIMKSDVPDMEYKTRFYAFKEFFLSSTNSELMAAASVRSNESDELIYVDSQYCPDDFEIVEMETDPFCAHCKSSLFDDLFQTVNGLWCRECIASSLLHQLRLNQFPLEIPLSAGKYSAIYLLPAILPMPVVSLIIRMSYRFLYSLDHPQSVFTRCPKCSLPHTVPEINDFDACSCIYCGCYWCYFCGWEPHWPMTCTEYREWEKKWSTQYLYEKFLLDKNEKLLRIPCCCGRDFYAPERTANGMKCPNRKCCYRYDRGMCRDPSEYYQWFWEYRAKRHQRGRRGGYEATPDVLEPMKLIRKEFAELCTLVRNERFNASKKNGFEKAASKRFSADECHSIMELRKMVLFVVENCTAWLYLHRHEEQNKLRKAVLRLFKTYTTFREQILNLGCELTVGIRDVQNSMEEVVALFRQRLENERDTNIGQLLRFQKLDIISQENNQTEYTEPNTELWRPREYIEKNDFIK
ncbi:unnamed protein product [Cylicocyclus nassatus]|uniref:Uncharacterized protein n=1 Tax=Cylicocyclus nassatus TaxID=53992 RepID=A0AA36GV90_CYLNA|nr:unnamed protein product [Cylicocyclus nassatus]